MNECTSRTTQRRAQHDGATANDDDGGALPGSSRPRPGRCRHGRCHGGAGPAPSRDDGEGLRAVGGLGSPGSPPSSLKNARPGPACWGVIGADGTVCLKMNSAYSSRALRVARCRAMGFAIRRPEPDAAARVFRWARSSPPARAPPPARARPCAVSLGGFSPACTSHCHDRVVRVTRVTKRVPGGEL